MFSMQDFPLPRDMVYFANRDMAYSLLYIKMFSMQDFPLPWDMVYSLLYIKMFSMQDFPLPRDMVYFCQPDGCTFTSPRRPQVR
jgi:uncharacterized membrane protein (UPF0127 family)